MKTLKKEKKYILELITKISQENGAAFLVDNENTAIRIIGHLTLQGLEKIDFKMILTDTDFELSIVDSQKKDFGTPTNYSDKNTKMKILRYLDYYLKLFPCAIRVLGNAENASSWLQASIIALGGKTPLEYAESEGIEEVFHELSRIEWGVFS